MARVTRFYARFTTTTAPRRWALHRIPGHRARRMRQRQQRFVRRGRRRHRRAGPKICRLAQEHRPRSRASQLLCRGGQRFRCTADLERRRHRHAVRGARRPRARGADAQRRCVARGAGGDVRRRDSDQQPTGHPRHLRDAAVGADEHEWLASQQATGGRPAGFRAVLDHRRAPTRWRVVLREHWHPRLWHQRNGPAVSGPRQQERQRRLLDVGRFAQPQHPLQAGRGRRGRANRDARGRQAASQLVCGQRQRRHARTNQRAQRRAGRHRDTKSCPWTAQSL